MPDGSNAIEINWLTIIHFLQEENENQDFLQEIKQKCKNFSWGLDFQWVRLSEQKRVFSAFRNNFQQMTDSAMTQVSVNGYYKISHKSDNMLYFVEWNMFRNTEWYDKLCEEYLNFVLFFLNQNSCEPPIKIAQMRFLLDENNDVFFDLTSKNNWGFGRRTFSGQA